MPLRPWSQFLFFYDYLAQLEGSAVFEAQLLDPDVIEEMARSKERYRASSPRLFGWTKEYSAQRDILDQLIASRGGQKFVPRPKIPGFELRVKKQNEALKATVARICGSD